MGIRIFFQGFGEIFLIFPKGIEKTEMGVDDYMKRIVSMMLLAVVVCLCSCGDGLPKDYNPKVVELPGCGTVKVPENWELVIKDGLACFVDENGPILSEYRTEYIGDSNVDPDILCMCVDGDHNEFSYHLVSDLVSSTGLSNSAIYGMQKIEFEGETVERRFLILDNTDFIVWDTTLSREELAQIAKSFEILLAKASE